MVDVARERPGSEIKHFTRFTAVSTATPFENRFLVARRAIHHAVRNTENRFENLHPHRERVERQRVDAEGRSECHRRGKNVFAGPQGRSDD